MRRRQLRDLPRANMAVLAGIAALTGALAVASVAAEEQDTAVLNTLSYWRCYVTLRPVMFGTQKAAKPAKLGTFHPSGRRRPVLPPDGPTTPLPPAEWTQPDFDDGAWWRQPGPFFGGEFTRSSPWTNYVFSRYGNFQPPSLALICLRGKFRVTDPARVQSVKLSVTFRGGLIVHLNGTEVTRRFLPEGDLSPETLADDYPWEAWVDRGGGYRYLFRTSGRDGVEVRARQASDVELPVRHMRKGLNVVALELHRSAQHPKTLTHYKRGSKAFNRLWNTVGFVGASLVARGDGISPNVGRPPGLQVWSANPLESVFECSYGDPNEALRPIRIVGTRNGSFSGQVVVGSDAPIRGLRAQVSDLKHETGEARIGASSVQVRYPRATAKERGGRYVHRVLGRWGGFHSLRFDALHETPLAEAPVQQIGDKWKKLYPAPKWIGAVQPVWLTLRVPPDAVPGRYRGTLTLRTRSMPATAVPVELEVYGYRLPDPAEFRTSVGFLEMPESLADHYKVPLWSDRHWQMIRQSMGFLSRIGSRVLFVPFICRTHFRNKQSMVRWIRAGQGYRHDFTLMERYLDTAVKAGFRPKIVCLQVWDYHVGSNPTTKIGTGLYGQSWLKKGMPVPVTLFDPKTKRVEEMKGPRYKDPEAEAFWKPVAEGARAVLKKRGLKADLALGICGDYIPSKETVALWAKLLPEARWVTMAHGTTRSLYGRAVQYGTAVFIAHYRDPALERRYGWQRRQHIAYFPRYADNRASFGMSYERTFFEFGLLCGLRGAGRQTLDDFRDYRVRSSWGGGCCWGSLTPGPAWLAPGPDGPLSTERYEMGLEGVQECEARILLEEALTNEKVRAQIGDKLAAACQAVLDRRARYTAWANEQNTNGRLHSYLPYGPLGSDWYACGSNWQERSAKLYAAAAQVAQILSKAGRATTQTPEREPGP